MGIVAFQNILIMCYFAIALFISLNIERNFVGVINGIDKIIRPSGYTCSAIGNTLEERVVVLNRFLESYYSIILSVLMGLLNRIRLAVFAFCERLVFG